ncbi:probable LRR receptor-like serine/threonine-protein kinase MEE39 isoform X1 [Brassica rapa]|uniref:probable LRR receptor-like serine/threonine-protein kinase MEE39 isoform X1 n=1 Tax=Brassica campestris TaxID=3711 RepID=UPI0004F19312|nr:probable LRR receptor-like serine/threonine-protein kinase MEE39 isoform X1 [Brassica rapa]XP_033137075.1 probable LRR receptor-like serine/threonine-protein kinase MEE39 isoform X1 [Brassica rapa]XP_033137076.1 probable LRR receptor-like serine/threonine-protein kinase MEE39 isoform X1 [Brassica rapa]XP_033137081.1 probable LRR receptor-like serine/threonine-protein kinase MEE39 isoform X1 [Brassica rapa]
MIGIMKSPHGILLVIFSFAAFAITHLVEAQNQEGFITLDCGLPLNESPYVEPETEIQFLSDENFIQGGKMGRIPANLESENLKPYSTLRYFPDGIRNCYDIRVEVGRNYLIRAMFFYGNFDGLNVSPEFDMYIGPNKWTTIDLQKEPSGSGKEIIHISRSNSLQICLVKTGATTPMISTLELRPLANDTYLAISGSLKLNFRMYLSNSTALLRYPKDVYDRTWVPFFQPDNWTHISTTANVSNKNHYDPPQAVLKGAAIPKNLDGPLMITWRLENPDDQIYLYRHFAEIQDIEANDTREFDCLLNGETITINAINPKYLKIETMLTTIPKECNGGICHMQLIKTQRSTLPPLLNGFEVYSVLQLPQLQTNETEVVAIKNISYTYELNRINWQGDPCVPRQFLWDGLNCSISDISVPPKIISLNLSSSGLSGTIISHFQNLNHLEILDLSNNSLSGMVPEFLASMKSLLVINLNGNNLSGSIPKSLLNREREGLKLYFLGNKHLCLSSTCIDTKLKKKFPVTIVAPIASIAAVVVMIILLFVLRKKMSSSMEDFFQHYVNVMHVLSYILAYALRTGSKSEPWIKTKRRRFTYSEVLVMTKNLQQPLGEGGFGIVYHGNLNGSEQVAVKLLSQTSAQGYKEFKAEVELLLRVHHINLVSLVGYCDEKDHFALIYEYMSNGDLHQHLSGKHVGSVLDWGTRLQIAIEAALGLEYLHIGCKPAMVHRDIKSTNILLDEEFKAKIADFGLSRSFQVGGDQSRVSTVVAGTLGYLDPEYYLTSELSEKSDIYSFGILLLEIITNQRVIDQTRKKPNIAEWVTYVIKKGDTSKIVDPKLQGNYEPRSVWRALEVAMSCANPSSAKRPNMSQVIIKLKECLESENARINTNQDTNSPHSSVELRVTATFDSDMYPKAR